MKKITFSFLFCVASFLSIEAQTTTVNSGINYPSKDLLPKPYHPEEDAQAKINDLLKLAKKQHKHIFIQAGGNWCIWCLRFNYFANNVTEIKNILDKNYLYYHLNFSKENKNEKIFDKYVSKNAHYGYPFFIILSSKGNVLCVQESGNLESGEGYDIQKTKDFLQKWVSVKNK